MEEKELLKERFKSAIASAIKVIAENPNLEINFGKKKGAENNNLYLPEINKLKNKQDYTNIRALADSEALKIKYTDKKVYLKNLPKKWGISLYHYKNLPKGKISRTLYSIAEKIRYEKIGSDKLKGVKNNLIENYKNKIENKKDEQTTSISNEAIAEAFELYLRTHFFNINQNLKTKKILNDWKDVFDKNLKKGVEQLKTHTSNQNKFNSEMAQLISTLNFSDTNTEEDDEKNNQTPDDSKQSDDDNSKESNPLNQKSDEKQEIELGMIENAFDDLENEDNFNNNEIDEMKGNPVQRKLNINLQKDKYKIFTTEFDEIAKAENLEDKNEIARLRQNLDQQLTNLQNFISKLANKLQRKLMAKQNRSWEFDLEEGILDAAKLTRVVIHYHTKKKRVLILKIQLLHY